ncbi:MAG TPA: hypothetical protein VG892_07665 [Terriglobales bacterium]|nr:hypothetical protein [Terriglobales bacterium]
MSLTEKIIDGLRGAKAFDKANPGKVRISDFEVRIQPRRAALINKKTGSMRIIPLDDND